MRVSFVKLLLYQGGVKGPFTEQSRPHKGESRLPISWNSTRPRCASSRKCSFDIFCAKMNSPEET